jgi:hypothetical protein
MVCEADRCAGDSDMGMTDSRARIDKAMKELLLVWSYTTHTWRDSNADAFQKKYIDNWEHDMRNTTQAMDAMGQVLGNCRRECE